MSITQVSGIQFNITSICRSRGEVAESVDFNEGGVNGGRVTSLNDLAILLPIDESGQASAAFFSVDTLINIGQALPSAQGANAVEKFLNALESVCGAGCSGLPEADRVKADALLTLGQLAPATFQRLAALEADPQRNGAGIQRILTAITDLVAELAGQLNLAQDQVNVAYINQQIKDLCKVGVPVTTPPVIPPVVPPGGGQPTGEPLVEYGVSYIPSYDLYFSDISNDSGPRFLQGHAALGFNVSNKLRLQIDYSGYVSMFNDIKSREGRDFGAISIDYQMTDLEIIVQGAFLYNRDVCYQQDEYLGSVGAGVVLFNGLFYPFAGANFGASHPGDLDMGGFYVGARSTYIIENAMINKDKLEISGQLLYNLLYRDEFEQYQHQVGGSFIANWRTPVSLWGSNLAVGLGVGVAYDSSVDSAIMNFGLFLSLLGALPAPQPIRWGGF
jgi:hypothetical protein